jgi:hypothetical protein
MIKGNRDMDTDDIAVLSSGSYYTNLKELTGILLWSLSHFRSQDLATVLSTVYELSAESSLTLRTWDETEVYFNKNRVDEWNAMSKKLDL